MGSNNDVSVTSIPNYDYIANAATNPQVLISLTVFIIIIYLIVTGLGALGGDSAGTSEKQSSLVFLEVLLWAVFLFLLFVNGAVYFFGFDIKAALNSSDGKPEVDISVVKPSSSGPKASESSSSAGSAGSGSPQVFHIPGNDYVYEDAKALCKAYGARLANYNELEQAYNKGAEWCSYGWSDDQLALFPTQKETYNKLQTIEGHEKDCGRPGINGGYIDNKAVRFGVNCYGVKPKITSLEREIMNNTSKYPKTYKDMAQEKRTDYWSDHLKDIVLAPFNYESWNKV